MESDHGRRVRRCRLGRPGRRHRSPNQSGPDPLILVLTASFRRLQQGIERIVPHPFCGGWYDKSVVSRMAREFSDALDLETIVRLLVEDVTGTMRRKAMVLLLPPGEGTGTRCLGSETGFDLPENLCHGQAVSELLQRVDGSLEHRALRERAEPMGGHGQELSVWSGARWWERSPGSTLRAEPQDEAWAWP